MNYLSKSYALDEEVIEALVALKGQFGSVNKGLRAVLIELKADSAFAKPEASTSDPASIPGVHRGLPPRESGVERAARERRERQERVAALDPGSGDRDDIDRSDDFVSG